MNKKEVMLVIASFALVLCLLSFASAAGVSSSYWYGDEEQGETDRPVEIVPGETKIVSLNLQNKVGDSEITTEVSIKAGEEIASIQETMYNVSLGSSADIPVEISIPKDAEIGEEYKVSVEFDIGTPGEGGTVKFSSGVTKSFPVKAVEKTEEKKTEEKGMSQILTLGIAVLIVVILIVILSRKPKKGSKKKK